MTMPARFSSKRICSRNFFGIACVREISLIISELSGGALTRATSARSAYLAFCEIMNADLSAGDIADLPANARRRLGLVLRRAGIERRRRGGGGRDRAPT